MGRTLEDMISSESPEVVQRAKALAEEQLVRLSVTKLLSNLGPGDVPAIDPDVLDSLLSLKRLGKVRTSIPRTKNENFSHLISMGYQ